MKESLRNSSDYEQKKNFLLDIKELLNDPNQESGIERQVNVLKEHSSIEVQKGAKKLAKIYETVVDVSVKNNSNDSNLAPVTPVKGSQRIIRAKNETKTVHQVPLESTFSTYIRSYVTSSHLNNSGALQDPSSFLTSVKKNEQNSSLSEEQRLENARKRLRESYQAAEKAKMKRRIQILDDLPRTKGCDLPKTEGLDLPKTTGRLIVRIKCRPKQTVK